MSTGNPESSASEEAAKGRELFLLMERINRIILGAPDLESVLAQVLDMMLELFDCERAWLIYPCDPNAESFGVPMERTRPAWPGAGAGQERLPMDPFVQRTLATALAGPSAQRMDDVHQPASRDEVILQRFGVQSQMLMAIHPRSGQPWCLGIHHCVAARVYDDEAAALFESIGARLGDGLTGLLAHRASLADKRRLEQAQHIAQVGSYEFARSSETYWSQELYRLLGLAPGVRPKEFRTVLECIHPDDRERARITVGAVMEHGGEYDFQVRAVRPSGEEWIMQARGRASIGTDGRLEHMIGVAQDVTERVRAEDHRLRLEAQLRQSQKMESLGQLTGGVAHDFNNLLTVILGNLDEIPEALERGTGKVIELVDEVSGAARRAAQLTLMLTAFSRRQPLKPEVLNVNVLLTRVESMLRRTLGEPIAIEVIRGAGLWLCEIDPAQLENALLNLALNARDAMPGGGKLTIETANTRVDHEYAAEHDVTPGQYVLIAVTDNGYGMSADTLGRAFEPFFTTKSTGHGTGLGLSMVYGFVKQSGGHVKLYSELGEGTIAKIYLPRTTHAEPKPERSPSGMRPAVGQGEMILIVEDDPNVRALTVRIVQRLGYRVAVAHDGPSALAVLAADPGIELLFTDVVLPGGMNGAELARQALLLRPGLPVLYTSGYTENAIIHHGRLDPGVKLLEKPFTRASLARFLEEALAEARAAKK